ncbi:MAG: hypothetical protein DMF95_18085 [Acidobacteria bacterium]|nr:MAG: hypothetical protein DMF96_08670 [Acidobacteriota bacterium]PYR14402.1 MAG: hypothetical protein DMF94_34340 [Acidobacteriota bacterium]PYR46652.1 MAG: hypothetical protein DMF95_18085 [Acidobacteriota bacterium]
MSFSKACRQRQVSQAVWLGVSERRSLLDSFWGQGRHGNDLSPRIGGLLPHVNPGFIKQLFLGSQFWRAKLFHTK